MSFATINTILTTAPIVVQAASKLVKLIRNQGEEQNPDGGDPDTPDDLKSEVARLHRRLDANHESDVEQIKLIEALAKQNESLAAQLKQTIMQLNWVTLLALIAVVAAAVGITIALMQ